MQLCFKRGGGPMEILQGLLDNLTALLACAFCFRLWPC